MQSQQSAPRPPFVRFERRSLEKRKPVEEGGLSYFQDVDFALITPLGDKDTRERIVTDWFAQLEQDMLNDRVPPQWVEAFKAKYEAFKSGQELPPEGTPIKTWPAATPSEVRLCLSLNVLTVEDLAEANETLLGRLGMGSRALKQRAVTYLAEKTGAGAVAEEMAALKVQNEGLLAINITLREQLQALDNKVNGLLAGAGAGSVPSSGSLESRLADAQGSLSPDPETELFKRI